MVSLKDTLRRAKDPEPDKNLLDHPISSETDAPELLVTQDIKKTLIDVLDVGMIISYEDSKGQQTQRRIRVTRFSENREGELVIHAYCYERRAARCFLSCNVLEIADPITGELIDDPYDFLWELQSAAIDHPELMRKNKPSKKPKNGIRNYQAAYKHCYSGIKALVYLARCDNQYHEKEHAVITQYCLARIKAADKPIKFDEVIFANYARTQFPDYSAMEFAMANIERSDRNTRIFWQHAQMLIEADGKIVTEETLAWSELQDILEQKKEKQAQLLREIWRE
jgi:hypothetical protein